MKHFTPVDDDPICKYDLKIVLMSRSALSPDNRLGKLAKLTPPTEDTYDFNENWPAIPEM
jgi:hypothetical protein